MEAAFDAGLVTSDAGALLLRATDQLKVAVAQRLSLIRGPDAPT